MFKKLGNILIITLVIIVTIISMANLQPVTFNLLFFSFEIPLIILLYLLLITGFSAGYIIKGFVDFRKNRRKRLSEKQSQSQK